MTPVPFEKLLESADAGDKAELKLAHNGRVEAMKAYQDKPGKATKEDLAAARDFYDETVERLARKYFPEQSNEPEGEFFRNRKQAHDWLLAQGYKVSQRTFYNACEAGFPGVRKDKTVSRFQVLQYAQNLDTEQRSPSEVTLSQREQELKVQKLENDVRKQELENRKEDERWLIKEEAWAQIAGLVGILRDALRHHFHMGQARLVHLAAGDPTRGPEVYEGCEEILSTAFNEIAAAGRVDVLFDEEDED